MAAFLDAWKKVKSDHKELSNSSKFKPDLGQLIARYEYNAKKSIAIDQEKEKLQDLADVLSKQGAAAAAKQSALSDELKKVKDEHSADTTRLFADLQNKSKDSIASMTALVAEYEDFVKTHESLNQQIMKKANELLVIAKKILATYKARRDANEAANKKIQIEIKQTEAQIRSTITAYVKVAVQMDDVAMANDIRGLLKNL